MIEASTIRGSRRMPDAAFDEVYWLLQPQLMRYAIGLLDPVSAEDMVSMTFLTLFRKGVLAKPSSTAGHHGLRRLAYKVLDGFIKNEYRRRKRRDALNERLIAMGEYPDAHPGPDWTVDQRVDLEQLLALLSPEHRQAILLFNAGFSVADCAEIQGCSVTAAAKRRSRARQVLRGIVTMSEIESGEESHG